MRHCGAVACPPVGGVSAPETVYGGTLGAVEPIHPVALQAPALGLHRPGTASGAPFPTHMPSGRQPTRRHARDPACLLCLRVRAIVLSGRDGLREKGMYVHARVVNQATWHCPRCRLDRAELHVARLKV